MNRLIDAIRRVRSTRPRPGASEAPAVHVEAAGQRVLVVYLFEALGDAVLLGPALAALLDAGVKPPLGILARPSAARVLKLLDLPLRVHTLPDALHRPADDAGWRDPEVRAAADELTDSLRRRKYDVAVDLTARADTDARRWLAASGAEVRLGWRASHETAQGAGLTDATEDIRFMGERHWSRYLTLPLAPLGVTGPRYAIGFTKAEAADAKAAAIWPAGDGPRVVLVPGSRSADKRWDPERFERLGRWVVEEAGGRVVVVGAPSEGKLVRGVVKAVGGRDAAAAYVKKDLVGLLGLVRTADAVVTNDTGPMHFAFLSGTPTVAIFTSMSPVCWGPPATDPRFVVLRVPRDGPDDAGGVYTRAALHYLDGLLSAGAAR